ncbi:MULTISPECIES: TIGR04063 family PEP-CTERM/XrtA system glycosyltransferase [unclassified Duganella]|uniref:TIGR04063 family PEP-CTERM/XrtA system glycosyltransferase n=1 Tax=unclassified Duganella TaxID=2636909 RepID=UPI000E343C89|nr:MULTISPECIES: TIGR04063 family PEP-CTERM/XrtA system glycosyltransferase [unclassified Duganella]RFP19663.1 glycosyltransferase, exosortase A system-associated [Duganella sp. BJB475]RFP36687.1 glycosyltransferase, exosortase A system-associated [Duganella sp. BJB476]
MRVLHILDHSLPLHSGYTFRTLAILRQQRKLGWHTIHLTGAKQGGGQREQEVDGWHFFRTPPLVRWWARLPLLRHWSVVLGLQQRLMTIAAKARPHVLHAHSPALNGVAALRVGRALGIPVVYEIRAFWEDAATDHGTSRAGGLRYRLTRALESHVLRRADAITTICEGLRNDIVARGIPAAKVTVIPNSVDGEQFSAASCAPEKLSLSLGLDDHLVLAFIGSFYAYEGLALLIEAMPRVLAAAPSVQLLLVGGGPQEAELRALVDRLDLRAHVKFTGRVPHERIADYYQLADILVYPRLPMRLTELVTPLKPLEAMAQGRLVLASDVGGHRELIEHGQTGMLFKAGDAEALAAQVMQLLQHADSWPALRQRARAYVESERNWPASVARYGPIYQRLRARTA